MNVAEILAASARTRPDHIAVIADAASGQRRTHRELDQGAQLAGKKPKAVEFAATLSGITPRGGSVRPVGGST